MGRAHTKGAKSATSPRACGSSKIKKNSCSQRVFFNSVSRTQHSTVDQALGVVAKLEQLGVEAASVEGCVLSGAERLLARGRYEAQRFAPRGHLKHSPLLAMGARVLGSPLASLPAAAQPPSKDDAWRDAGGRARERACDELTQAARRVGEMLPGQRRQGAAALWAAPPSASPPAQ